MWAGLTARRWTARRPPHVAPGWCWARSALVIAVLVANGPYLIGAIDPNPLLAVSGLQRHTSPGLFPGVTSLDPNSGFTSQAGGHRAALDWLHLRWPWWDPWESTGTPLAGSIAAGALFFPFVLLLWFSDGQVVLYALLDIIAGLATLEVLRKLDVGPWICFVGGVIFALNGTNAWFRFAADNPVAFLPVTILGVETIRSAVLDRRRGGWVLVAAGVGLALLASFPETAVVDAGLAVVWLLARSLPSGLAATLAVVRRAVLGAAVGLLVAGPAIVALATFYPHASVAGHAGDGFGHLSIPAAGAVTTLAPYALGPLDGLRSTSPDLAAAFGGLGGYLTAAVAVAALAGVAGRRLRPLRIALALLAAVLLARNFGFPPAVHLLLLVPGAAHIALFRYDDPAIELVAAALAALAFDDARRRSGRWLPPVVALGLTAVAGAYVWHLAQPVERTVTGPHARLWWQVGFGWAAATAALVAVGLALGRRRALIVVAGGILVVEAVVMFAVPEGSAPRDVQIDTTAVAFLRSHVGTGRFFSFGPFAPNYGAYFGVASLDVNDNPLPMSIVAFEAARLSPNGLPVVFNGVNVVDPTRPTPLQDLATHLDGYLSAGVDYVVVPAGTPLPALPPGAAKVAYRDPVMDIYRLTGASPYFTATGGCRTTSTGRTEVSATCPDGGQLLRRETMLPGWTATVDGHVEVPRPSGPFQVIDLPRGTSTTRFTFVPPYEGPSLVACLLGVLLLLVLPRVDRRLERRRTAGPPEGTGRPGHPCASRRRARPWSVGLRRARSAEKCLPDHEER